MSIGTTRIISLAKGIKYLAPIIAFFETVIWLLAIEIVMRDPSNIANFLAFAFGFAMSTYMGLVIEEKLSISMVILRIVMKEDSTDEIVSFMQSENYGVTTVKAKG